MLQVITPPFKTTLNLPKKYTSIFLAGSIEMGKAEDWQSQVIQFFSNKTNPDLNIVIYNPRRKDWDNSWETSFENPQFNQQVNWEVSKLEKADHIILNFVPGTMSPISILEFGLFAESEKLIVCCPKGFWRKGNIDIICEKYNIPLFENLETLLKQYFDE
jgi:hypothetical protein